MTLEFVRVRVSDEHGKLVVSELVRISCHNSAVGQWLLQLVGNISELRQLLVFPSRYDKSPQVYANEGVSSSFRLLVVLLHLQGLIQTNYICGI